MESRIILYNLRENITDESYAEYCRGEKGPFLRSLPSCKRFTLVRLVELQNAQFPFKYMGVVEISSATEWEKDRSSPSFQDFLNEWGPKVKDVHMLAGEEVFNE